MGMKRSGLGDVLFSRTQQRVLALLFGSPDRSFYANEVVRLAGVGIGSVQRELERMATVGLITSEKIGNQKHYRANRSSPIFDELRAIVLKTFGLVDLVRA